MGRRVAIAAGALVLALAAAATWQLARDPLASLPRLTGEIVARTVTSEREGGRQWRQVRLRVDGHAPVRLRISLPDPLPGGALPVVFVLGGLETGARSVRHLPAPGANVLVGYDWPIPHRLPSDVAAPWRLAELRRHVLSVPGEVSLAMRWITAQPWADSGKLSLVGLSLGALAAPAIQRLAAAEGVAIHSTVLGYGGAPLGLLAAHHPAIEPDWLRPVLRAAADLLLRPLEPARHLPHLGGAFLVLGGTGDVLVPGPAARRFAALTPEPKAVRWIAGAHLGIGSDADALLAEVIERSVRWLRERNAVAAPARRPQDRPR